MNINVHVDDVHLSDVVSESYDGTPSTLGDHVTEAIVARIVRGDEWHDLRRRVEEIRDDKISEQVDAMVTEAVQRPVQPTNTFGEPSGQPTTLRELVVKQAHDTLKKPTSRDVYGRETLLQSVVREEVERALRKELVDAVKAEREKVVAAVRAEAGKVVAEAVARGVGVST